MEEQGRGVASRRRSGNELPVVVHFAKVFPSALVVSNFHGARNIRLGSGIDDSSRVDRQKNKNSAPRHPHDRISCASEASKSLDESYVAS